MILSRYPEGLVSDAGSRLVQVVVAPPVRSQEHAKDLLEVDGADAVRRH